MVKAPAIAAGARIGSPRVKHERDSDYDSLIRIKVKRRRQVALGRRHDVGGKPRIVEVKGIELEADFQPLHAFVNNSDKPGFIGAMAGLLGESQGQHRDLPPRPRSRGGDAIAIVGVDQPLSAALTAQIGAVEGVVQAKALGF